MLTREIRGGKLHKLLYTYNHSKTGEATLEDATWKIEALAINSGTEFQEQLLMFMYLRKL